MSIELRGRVWFDVLPLQIGTHGTPVAMARGDGERYCAPQRPRRARALPARTFHPPAAALVRSLPVARPKRSLGPTWTAGSKSCKSSVQRVAVHAGQLALRRVELRARPFRPPSWPNRPSRVRAAGRRARRLAAPRAWFASQASGSLPPHARPSLTPGLLARRRLHHPVVFKNSCATRNGRCGGSVGRVR